MDRSTDEQNRRYTATPRQCVDCGGPPSAGRPRCDTCHHLHANRPRPPDPNGPFVIELILTPD